MNDDKQLKKKTASDVIHEVAEEVQHGDTTERDRILIEQIETVVKEVKGEGVSGKDYMEFDIRELSKIQGTLAGLKDSLVDVIARTKRSMDIQDSFIELRKGNLFTALKQEFQPGSSKTLTDTMANKRIKTLIFKDSVKRAFREELYNRALYKWRSLNTLIDVITSRINVLQSQKADSGIDDSLDFDLLDK